MTCNRYHLWAALDVHAFSKAEAVLRFSAEEDGMWVQWQDYASLKAEVERLRKFNDEALAHIAKEERKSRECLDMAQAEVERLRNLGIKLDGYVDLLQGENERLRKAGDACADAAYAHCMCQDCEELRDQWRDAKRGKQP